MYITISLLPLFFQGRSSSFVSGVAAGVVTFTSLAIHNRCALHLSWWLTISRRKLQLPSANDVRMSGMLPLHLRQYLQNIMLCCSSYCSHMYASNQPGRKRPPLRPGCPEWRAVPPRDVGVCITDISWAAGIIVEVPGSSRVRLYGLCIAAADADDVGGSDMSDNSCCCWWWWWCCCCEWWYRVPPDAGAVVVAVVVVKYWRSTLCLEARSDRLVFAGSNIATRTCPLPFRGVPVLCSGSLFSTLPHSNTLVC